MAKVKESTRIPFKEEDGTDNCLYIAWDCDDEEGYGVEISTQDTGIMTFSFGQDNQDDMYRFSFTFYVCVSDLLQKDMEGTLALLDTMQVIYPDNMENLETVKLFVSSWIQVTGAIFN